MNDTEVLSLLANLEGILVDVGLQAVVDQERTAMREGRPVEVTREELRSRPRGNPDQKPVAGDVRRVAISPRERLASTLDYIEVAVGGSFALEARVQGIFDDIIAEGAPIAFSTPLEEGFAMSESPDWAIDRSSLRDRQNAVQEVMTVVSAIRDDVGLERSEWLRRHDERKDLELHPSERWA